DAVRVGDPSAIPDILTSGYLSLLYRCLPLRPGESALYFDLVPDSVLIVDKGELEFVPKGLSPILKGFVRQVQRGDASKEELIEKLWGYRYDPLRHDSLIYQTVSRLRQLLGTHGRWIEATERGYRLNAGVEVRFHQVLEKKLEREAQPVVEELQPSDLN